MINSKDIEFKRHYMRNNYFVTIDGKKIYLTDEQIVLLGLKRSVLHSKGFGKQVALHQLLYRKLLKFACDNGYDDTESWKNESIHYSIYFNTYDNIFEVAPIIGNKYFEVYFSSEEGAEQAIEKVVKPFMNEHPDFVW